MYSRSSRRVVDYSRALAVSRESSTNMSVPYHGGCAKESGHAARNTRGMVIYGKTMVCNLFFTYTPTFTDSSVLVECE